MSTSDKTPAQLFALLAGGVLVLVGLVGFIADASFEVGRPHESGELLGILEVNGIHNLIHIATGALLLSGAGRADTAKAVTLVFASAYALVTIIGLVQGDTVLGIIPINGADNVLHILLTVVAFLAYAASRTERAPRTAATAR